MFHTKVQDEIGKYISSQPEAKRSDMQELHMLILSALPGCKVWFDDGIDDRGKIVTNPTIGYGEQTLKYADGKTKPFFQIGLSANTTGISVYIMGIADKTYLSKTYSEKLGKATVTGYCIKFKKLKDINMDVLIAAVQDGVRSTAET
jgi:hypothetical protein